MGGMEIGGIILMVVGLIGMIFCSKKQKTNPAMQPVALGCFLVVIAGAVMMLYTTLGGGGDQGVIENELHFANSRGYVIGQYAAKNYAGKKVLFITELNADKNENAMKIVEAFKAGMGSDNVVCDTLAVPADFEKRGMTMEEVMKAKDFDALLAKHADAAVIVSSIGLPNDAMRMKFFLTPAAKRPALFLVSNGSFFGKNLAGAVKAGAITAVVMPNPKAKYDVKAPKDMAEAFKIRYNLVDKANFEQNKGSF